MCMTGSLNSITYRNNTHTHIQQELVTRVSVSLRMLQTEKNTDGARWSVRESICSYGRGGERVREVWKKEDERVSCEHLFGFTRTFIIYFCQYCATPLTASPRFSGRCTNSGDDLPEHILVLRRCLFWRAPCLDSSCIRVPLHSHSHCVSSALKEWAASVCLILKSHSFTSFLMCQLLSALVALYK